MSKGDGYIPHYGMLFFKCPVCGCEEFSTHPQTAPADGSRAWTWEYVCTNCGQGMGLTVRGRL